MFIFIEKDCFDSNQEYLLEHELRKDKFEYKHDDMVQVIYLGYFNYPFIMLK